MKKISLTLLISAFIAQPSEADLVPNGEFRMYKPGTNYTVEATFGVGNNSFAKGVGDGIELSGGTVTYSDGSADGVTGDGIPDIDMPGWAPLQSGNDLFGNGVDGSNGMNLFAAWGGDGRIQSAAPLGIIESGSVYTISVMVGGPDAGPIQGPLAFHLAADGVQLTPSAVVDPTLPNGGAFQEISRTYDADSIAGHIGAEMTIVLGVEDANDFSNRVVFENVSIEVVPGATPVQLDVTQVGGDLVISWDSQAGMLYNLRSETDPSNGEPKDWPIFDGNGDIAATPDTNTLTIALPPDPSRYFVIEEFPAPPVSVFSDDFESGQGTWMMGSDGDAGSEWELGTPTIVGPATTNSGVNCFGTNLDGTYEINAEVWLRSPSIDLTGATGATLTYAEFKDIEAMFDSGTVSVLDANDDTLIVELASDIEGTSLQWDPVSHELPAEALGKAIKIEFRMFSDTFTNLAGWYIDDVEVTTPAP